MTSGLLQAWEVRRPAEPAWEQASGVRWDAWADVKDAVAELAEGWDRSHLHHGALAELAAILMRAPAVLGVDALHAAAWGIDEGAYALLVEDWCAPASQWLLGHGELYPVGEPDPRVFVGAHVARTSRPSSLTEPVLGELPHVRRNRAVRAQIVIEPRYRTELEPIARSMRPLATAHTNAALDEFDQPRAGIAAIFPISVRDADLQRERVLELTRQTVTVDARIVVFPELSTTPQLIDDVRQVVDRAPGRRLVIAGSYHHHRDHGPVNTAVGVIARSGAVLEHDKLAAFAEPGGTKEGIERGARLVVYEAGEFRVAIATCKDLLDDEVRGLYRRMGVNLLLVPALSVKTSDFATHARALVASNQAVTLMANGILTTPAGAAIDPAAVLAQPIAGAELVTGAVVASDVPELVVFSVGETQPISR